MAIVFPGGTQGGPAKILKVVNTLKTDNWSTSSSAWTTVTGLTISFTPSDNTNKVLVSTSVVLCGETQGRRFAMRLIRNSTPLQYADAAGNRVRASYGGTAYGGGNGGAFMAALQILDSPATTSTVTYAVQAIALDGGSVRVNWTNNDTNNSTYSVSASTITCMEVDA
jgi:hypothetical protein